MPGEISGRNGSFGRTAFCVHMAEFPGRRSGQDDAGRHAVSEEVTMDVMVTMNSDDPGNDSSGNNPCHCWQNSPSAATESAWAESAGTNFWTVLLTFPQPGRARHPMGTRMRRLHSPRAKLRRLSRIISTAQH